MSTINRKTMTYEELKAQFDDDGYGRMEILLKHLLQQEIRIEATEIAIRNLTKRTDSMDEDLFETSETVSNFQKNVEDKLMGKPNPNHPVEGNPNYLAHQGFAETLQQRLRTWQSSHIQFDSPQKEKHFLAALKHLRVFDADITENELIIFLSMLN